MPVIIPVVADSSYSGVECHHEELVQNWINTLPQCRLHSTLMQADTPLNKTIAIESEDDLALGAEAQLFQLNPSVINQRHCDDSLQCRGNEVLDARHILRQRFAQTKDQSFNSDSSRHSMEQLLKQHVIDAEHVLNNLGFLSHCNNVSTRLPQRFLVNTSKANGISVENYVKENCKVGNGVETTKVPEEHYTIMDATLPSHEQGSTEIISTGTGSGTGFRMFSKVAQTVTLINRFRAKALRRPDLSGTADPVVRTSTRGSQYWTILEEENSCYLDRFGFYDRSFVVASSDNLSESQKACKQAWNVAKSSALKKIAPTTDSDTTTQLKHQTKPSNDEFDCLDYGVQKDIPKLGSNVGDIAVGETRSIQTVNLSDIPVRFMPLPSVNVPSSLEVVAAAMPVNIPTIEVNNNDISEWFNSSSVSSSTTDDNSPSFNNLSKLQPSKCGPSFVGNDSDMLNVLSVSSDNASTISSHTLVENDGAISKCVPDICDEQEQGKLAEEVTRCRRKQLQLIRDSFTTVDLNDDQLQNIRHSDVVTDSFVQNKSPEVCPEVSGDSDLSTSADEKADNYMNLVHAKSVTQSVFNRSNVKYPDCDELGNLHMFDERRDAENDDCQSRTYTTSMYIDSLIPSLNMSVSEKAEVVVILGSDHRSEKHDTSLSYQSASTLQSDHIHYRTVLDAEVIKSSCEDRLVVSPLNYRTIPVTLGHIDTKQSMFPDDFRHNIYHLPVTRKPVKLALDVTDHQILYSMMQHSAYLSPQCLSLLTSPSEWLSTQSNVTSAYQFLIEEVKLMQQAVNKYRLELNALRLKSRVQYAEETEMICADRIGVLELTTLHSAILEEINNLNMLLSQRMKFIISSITANEIEHIPDLAGLHVIDQMIEIIQEQLYHSSIINSMLTVVRASSPQLHSSEMQHCLLCHELTDNMSNASSAFTESIEGRISSLEQKIVEWQHSSENMIQNILQQFQVTLVEEMNK